MSSKRGAGGDGPRCAGCDEALRVQSANAVHVQMVCPACGAESEIARADDLWLSAWMYDVHEADPNCRGPLCDGD